MILVYFRYYDLVNAEVGKLPLDRRTKDAIEF
jgi:hypothetical protein